MVRWRHHRRYIRRVEAGWMMEWKDRIKASLSESAIICSALSDGLCTTVVAHRPNGARTDTRYKKRVPTRYVPPSMVEGSSLHHLHGTGGISARVSISFLTGMHWAMHCAAVGVARCPNTRPGCRNCPGPSIHQKQYHCFLRRYIRYMRRHRCFKWQCCPAM